MSITTFGVAMGQEEIFDATLLHKNFTVKAYAIGELFVHRAVVEDRSNGIQYRTRADLFTVSVACGAQLSTFHSLIVAGKLAKALANMKKTLPSKDWIEEPVKSKAKELIKQAMIADQQVA